MSEYVFSLEIHDQPDVLVRIMQAIHRRGGCIRSLRIEPQQPWAKMHIRVQGVNNPDQIARTLEKLVDARRVRTVTN